MENITKITLAWELSEAGVPKVNIAQNLSVNRDTVRLWLNGIGKVGLLAFLDNYLKAKKGPRLSRQVDPILKRWVWGIREREMDCCGQKIGYFLEKEYRVHLSVPKIYEILAEKFVIKSKWKKYHQRGPVPTATKPREVIQMDTVDFGEVFAFTAVDIFSREADVVLRPSLTSHDGAIFLDTTMSRRFNSHSELIQSDGGPEFKDEFKNKVANYSDRYRVASRIRRTSKVTLRVLTGLSEKSVWVG